MTCRSCGADVLAGARFCSAVATLESCIGELTRLESRLAAADAMADRAVIARQAGLPEADRWSAEAGAAYAAMHVVPPLDPELAAALVSAPAGRG